jgi:hypothetical protein
MLDETLGSDPSIRMHSLHSFDDNKGEFPESKGISVVPLRREITVELAEIGPEVHQKEL